MLDNWFCYLKSLVPGRKKQRRSAVGKVRRSTWRPRVELLEDRWAPATHGCGACPSLGPLILNGISFVYTAGASQYVLNGVTHTFTPADYSSIEFEGNGGAAVLTGYFGQSGHVTNAAVLRAGLGTTEQHDWERVSSHCGHRRGANHDQWPPGRYRQPV